MRNITNVELSTLEIGICYYLNKTEQNTIKS